MILIDSDILAIYHFFTHDARYQVTRECIDGLKGEDLATTIYNLLELAGILASGGKADLGEKIVSTYLNAADMEILFPRVGYLSGDILGRVFTWGAGCNQAGSEIWRCKDHLGCRST